MASAVACKGKVPVPASLLKSGAPVAFCALQSPAVTAARRPYNTQAKEVSRYDDDDDYSGRDLVIPSFFPQGMLPFPTCGARFLCLRSEVSTSQRSDLLLVSSVLILQTCSTRSARRPAWPVCCL